MNSRARQVLIFGGAILLVFLGGFLPQYLRVSGLERSLRQAEQRQEFCRVRDLSGKMFLQTSLKNFGLASGSATEFFEAAKKLAAETQSADSRQALQTALAQRDTITAQLARGDPAAYGSVQAVYQLLLERPAFGQ